MTDPLQVVVSRHLDVVVIGAGQAGLSSAYFLARAGVAPAANADDSSDGAGFVVLDQGPRAGGAWQHRWPSLRFGSAHRIYPLPGLPLPDLDPAAPASEVVSTYYASYEHEYRLPVHRPVRVTAVLPQPSGRLLVRTSAGQWSARAIVNATGTWTKPFWPYYPGARTFRGRQLHTADYRSALEFAGQHVVVVGGGNSAVQLLAEISEVTSTTWVTRREPVWHEGPFEERAGREAIAQVEDRVRLGLPPASVVSVTGLGVTPAVAAARARGALRRRPMFDRLTPDGVAWDDETLRDADQPDADHPNGGQPDGGQFVAADVILWCTGFRPALDHLAPLHLREHGGGIRMIGTQAARDPRVHLVGYGPSASTIGAARAGRTAARGIADLLAGRTTGRTSGRTTELTSARTSSPTSTPTARADALRV